MKVIVLGGFLGAGKTSVLLQLARYLVDTRPVGDVPTLAIIENEIGEVSVDGVLLDGEGYSVTNLFSGCICCSLATELTYGIHKIQQELNPEWVILESTGLAYPGAIRDLLRDQLDLRDVRTVVVADAERFEDIVSMLPHLAEGQIESAQTILLNKVDLVSEEQRAAAEAKVLALNPGAVVYSISASEPVDPAVWQHIEEGGGNGGA